MEKTNYSSSTTTSTNLTTGKKSTIQTSTVTKRRLGAKEQAQLGLSSIFRIEMIGITIITIAIGSAVSDFTTADLIETNPNYQVNNSYVGYIDPLEEINYVQYGANVVSNLTGFFSALSGVGNFAKNMWDGINNFVGDSWISQDGSFAAEFGEARWVEIYDHYQHYYEEGAVAQRAYIYSDILTLAEKTFIEDVNHHSSFSSEEKQVFLSTRWYLIYQDTYGLFGTVNNSYFFFTEPSVHTMIVGDL